jgi:hypothetical protein
MPDTSTLSPDVYIRGDTGAIRQVDATGNDVAVNGWLGGVVYRNVAASTAHAASTTETLFDTSYSIPANTLKAGSVIRIKFQGIATATAAAETLTVKLYIGGLTGTALLTGTATDATNNDIFTGEATVVIRTAGASGTLVAVASGNIVPAATRVAVPVYQITASTTIDTTAAQVVGVGADWSGAGANSARLDIMVVEIY